jgi:hypothetical protein
MTSSTIKHLDYIPVLAHSATSSQDNTESLLDGPKRNSCTAGAIRPTRSLMAPPLARVVEEIGVHASNKLHHSTNINNQVVAQNRSLSAATHPTSSSTGTSLLTQKESK